MLVNAVDLLQVDRFHNLLGCLVQVHQPARLRLAAHGHIHVHQR
jgi:hypothetical protein